MLTWSQCRSHHKQLSIVTQVDWNYLASVEGQINVYSVKYYH